MAATAPAHILIVDDALMSIKVIAKMLEADYEVSIAGSGRAALDWLAQGSKPDLILLDVLMPQLDGYAVCTALKGDPATRDIPVIFITARTDADSETQALRVGGVDFIHKPVNRAVLRARIHLHLELERRAKALQVYSQAIAHSPTSIVITGADAIIQYVNPHFTAESGYSSAESIGQNPSMLQSGLTPPTTFRQMWDRLQRGEPWTGEFINRRKSGEVYWAEAHLAPVKDADGTITHYIAIKLDITARKQAQERLAYLAHYDALTNLPNRARFFEHVGRGLELARRDDTKLALLFIDLDNFKPVNDTWGHLAGDRVLQTAGRRMTNCIRAADTVGRIGGDEFVVLLTNIGHVDNAVRVAEKIRESFRQPVVLTDTTLAISASIGIALYPDHGSDLIELARHADAAMYLAKQSGRNNVKVFRYLN